MEKVVLVTGASRGIGRKIAIDLSQKGYKFVTVSELLDKNNR